MIEMLKRAKAAKLAVAALSTEAKNAALVDDLMGRSLQGDVDRLGTGQGDVGADDAGDQKNDQQNRHDRPQLDAGALFLRVRHFIFLHFM